ncbi:MAG TPA: Hpt domain-containing protein [Planctomycetota bacterium]|nr:Hpt domain-containing protein [Planctomycetota bacterium]
MKDGRMAIDVTLDPAALDRLRELGGVALLSKMIDLFLENTPKRIQAALEGERTGNWHEVERAAHSIKSSAANLGLAGLRSLAQQVEALAEVEESGPLLPLLQELEACYPLVRVRLLDERKTLDA